LAKCQHPITDLHLVTIAESRRGQTAGALDADNGQIALRVGLHLRGFENSLVIKPHRHYAASLDYVIVREDPSARVDNKPRPDADNFTADFWVAAT
jgi:hypothetical protein